MKRVITGLICVVAFCTGCQESVNETQKNTAIDFSEVKITDEFWFQKIKKHSEITIPAVIRQNEVETHRIENFKIAAGIDTGKFEGLFYDDSDLYKVIEGCSYSLVNFRNPKLEAKVDEIIDIIAAAQRDDGYLSTYFMLADKDGSWTDMDKHEMYCCGHLIEAAVAYYNATKKDKLLNVAIKYADYLCSMFGEGKKEWVPGHPEIELALVKLFRVTGNADYLNLAHYLLEQRGRGEGSWPKEYRNYYLDSIPVANLSKISGHAVRAMYLFTGMADYCASAGDTVYFASLKRLWDDVVLTKMYITGGIGSSKENEGFTYSFDLPNDKAYCETCASVGMVFWNQRMNELFGDGKYIDVLERSLYNGLLAGVSLSMDRFFYVNPLESYGDHHRKYWYGTACCPSNISRFLPSVGGYIYAKSEDAIWVNLYIGSETKIPVGNTEVDVSMKTNYPWDGDVKIMLNPEKNKRFTMKLRMPAWCDNYVLSVNGEEIHPEKRDGYINITRKWRKNDQIALNMEMDVKVCAADPRVLADVGKRAIQRGPIVYCMEQIDNPEYDSAVLDSAASFHAEYDKNLLDGVVSIEAKTKNSVLHFIPYYAWDNREPGGMKVWVDYEEN